MAYNLEAWCRFLGNPMDDSLRTNFMYFVEGRVRSVGVTGVDGVEAAEQFVKLNDGRHQLYNNVNPCKVRVSGKPKDSDVPAVRNLYVDVDAVKADGMKKHPATDAELYAIPIDDISDVVYGLMESHYRDHTGNGYRFIVPMAGATARDEKHLVCLLNTMFPAYIDTSVTDPSRITGVPGTMNMKDEILGRPNRVRGIFKAYLKRDEVMPPVYTETQCVAIKESLGTKRAEPKDRPTRALFTPKESDVQVLLNKYILRCSTHSPWVLKLIELGPPPGDGFNYDGFWACEVLNKIGDAPRVYATIMRSMWGEEYNAQMTKKAWDDAVDSGMGAWAIGTVRRTFGNSIFEVK